MTIHVTQLEIDVAQGIINSNLYKGFNCYINPVALAMSKAFKVRCAAYSERLYISSHELEDTYVGGVKPPWHVANMLYKYPNIYMIPFSFDIEA